MGHQTPIANGIRRDGFLLRSDADGLHSLTVNCPVAFFIYHRPDLAAQVWQAIREARPPLLLVISDAAPLDRPDLALLCEQSRAIIQRTDWPCEVRTHFASQHLGCRRRFQTGLDWVFSQVERAVILEDDCLPDASFFPFCDQLLERYAMVPEVLMICGTNLQPQPVQMESSYYFSRYSLIWGWAGWKRTWEDYQPDLKGWEKLRDSGFLNSQFKEQHAVEYWTRIFQRFRDGFDTWDYALQLRIWQGNGYCIHPRTNLVNNLGFRGDATHTFDAEHPHSRLKTAPMKFPLNHPTFITRSKETDLILENVAFSGAGYLKHKFDHVRAHLRIGRATSPA